MAASPGPRHVGSRPGSRGMAAARRTVPFRFHQPKIVGRHDASKNRRWPALRARAPALARRTRRTARSTRWSTATRSTPNTMKGFRTWRAAACDRCHGANQEGLVGPSLVNSLKTLTKEEFVKTVTRRPAREGHAELRQQPAGDGQHRPPLRLPEGPLRRRHHPRQGRSRSNDPPRRHRSLPRCSRQRLRWPLLRASAPAAAQDAPPRAQGAARLPGPEQPAVLEHRAAKASRTRSPSCSARRSACRSPTTRSRSGWPSSATRCATSCPGRTIRCDIVMGVPAGFDQVSVTKPYYRSTYALVFAQGKGLDEVKLGRGLPQARPRRAVQAAHRHLRPLAGLRLAEQAPAGRPGRALPDA